MGVFHAYDIRGVYGKDLVPEDIYKMGFFLPTVLNTKRIAVGRDCRESSPEAFQFLVRGLCDAGAHGPRADHSDRPQLVDVSTHGAHLGVPPGGWPREVADHWST